MNAILFFSILNDQGVVIMIYFFCIFYLSNGHIPYVEILFAYVFSFVCWNRIWLSTQDWPETNGNPPASVSPNLD